MPQDYSNGKIYKIVSPSTGLVYIGSTCQKTLAQRLGSHRQNFRNWKIHKNISQTYMTSFILCEIDDEEIELIESYPCSNRDELSSRERQYQRTIECINQSGKSGKNDSETLIRELVERESLPVSHLTRYLEHREVNREYQRKRYEANKENVAESAKEYREKNKEKIAESRKEYRENNKEKIAESNKKYGSQRVRCNVCNKEVQRRSLRRHEKSNIHKSNQALLATETKAEELDI